MTTTSEQSCASCAPPKSLKIVPQHKNDNAQLMRALHEPAESESWRSQFLRSAQAPGNHIR